MDPSARKAILSIPSKDLDVAKPEELNLYARALEMQTQLLSPLDYAVTVSGATRFTHIELLNRWLIALMDGRLYFDGPGPVPVPLTQEAEAQQTTAPLVVSYSDEGLALDEDKLLILVHPTRGDRPVYNIAVSMPPRHGKQARTDEPVLTTKGWKLHGDLVAGDYVFGTDGSPKRVVAVSDVSRNDPKMRVNFSYGESLDVHPNHEWTVRDRHTKEWLVKETKDLGGRYGRAQYFLPPRPVLSGTLRLPNPYTLGVWLGDGRTAAPDFASSEEDARVMSMHIEAEGVLTRHMTIHKDTGVWYTTLVGAVLPVKKPKRIPEQCFTAHVEDRNSLLQGLVDTDGSVEPRTGRVRFSSVSEDLSRDVQTLAATLGYRATVSYAPDDRPDHTIAGNPANSTKGVWVTQWTPHDGASPGRLPRKGFRREFSPRMDGILSVEPAQPSDGNCIQVEGGTYLLGRELRPTHNSYLVSEHLPAWFLTMFPEYSVLLASYEQTFASEWGGKVRDHISDHPEYGVEVTGGRNASRLSFDLEGHRGFMKCAGAGGPITGKGGQLMICDDPIKNAQDAMSEIEREGKDNWWKTTFYTRREPWVDGTPGRVILMSTRWHEDDLHGRRVPAPPEIGSRWSQLNLMALFEPTAQEPTDPLGREIGVALCPQRIPKRELVELRAEDSMGEMWFQALYQGHPSLDEGNILKRPFRYFTASTVDDRTTFTLHTPDGEDVFVDQRQCYRFATLDLAASDRSHADWTVFMVFDVTPTTPRYLLVSGMERIRITTENHEEHVKEWYKRWKVRALHIENKTYGTNLIGRLLGTPGMIIQKLSGDAIPLVRVMPVQYELRNGRLWFPESAEWRTGFEAEITKFPNARHDDMVDCLAYGVEVFQNLPAHVVREPEPVTLEERVRAHAKTLAGRRKRKNRQRRYPGIGKW